jgi:L-rhamnose mutarotase
MCDGLHHKQYYVLNKPCGSAEEYKAKVAEIWKELLDSPEAGNLMSVFEDEEFLGIEH